MNSNSNKANGPQHLALMHFFLCYIKLFNYHSFASDILTTVTVLGFYLDRQALTKQCRSTQFATPSAIFGQISLWKDY